MKALRILPTRLDINGKDCLVFNYWFVNGMEVYLVIDTSELPTKEECGVESVEVVPRLVFIKSEVANNVDQK